MKTSVALVRCADYRLEQVQAAVDRAVELCCGGWEQLIPSGATVFLKPNLVSAYPPEAAACTHPAFVEAVLRRVLDCGGRPQIGDSPAFGSARRVAQKAGIAQVAARYGAPIVDLRRPARWIVDRNTTTKRFKLGAAALESDLLLNLPKLKAHRQMRLTAGVKNLYGCVAGKRKAVYHLTRGGDHTDFATMVLEHIAKMGPLFTLVDGIVAMQGRGPTNGEPYPLGLVIAGEDPIAVDRVIGEVLNLRPEDNPFLIAAERLGFGTPQLDRIHLLGDPLDASRVEDFRFPELEPLFFSKRRLVRSFLRDLWKRYGAASLF